MAGSDQTPSTSRAKSPELTAQRFGRYLRSLRHARSLSQERLAERCELSTDAIGRIESGRFSPSLVTLSKLAKGLEISLSTLFAGLERRSDDGREELADFLSRRTAKEREMAWRVLRALFDDG